MDVRGGKAQQCKSGVDQQVLPSVVFDQALAVVSSVVLDDETDGGVVEVGPAYEAPSVVMKVGLNLRPEQAGLE